MKLMEEVGWESLTKRREYLKLTILQRTIRHETPEYLTGLTPAPGAMARMLRNRNNLRIPQTRLAAHQASFIPSTIRLWNQLQDEVREIETAKSFKVRLKLELFTNKRIPLYSFGVGGGQIYHARMRMDLSALNEQIHSYNLIDNGNCEHCRIPEDVHHYLLDCPRYNLQRQNMMTELQNIPTLDPNNISGRTLMYGTEVEDDDLNYRIFKIVQTFIYNSNVFPKYYACMFIFYIYYSSLSTFCM